MKKIALGLGLAALIGILAHRTLWAENDSYYAPTVIKKLEEVTQGQQEILAKLEEIKQELDVVKVRATLAGG